MGSVDVIRQLRGRGLSDGELAARAGLARETLARWASGAQRPSLDALEKVAAMAGMQLDVRLVEVDAEHIALVDDQLDLGPTDRLKALLGPRRWLACRDALRAAAALGELAVLVGPVAAALSGAPQRPGDGRVDVLVAAEHGEEAFERLLAADARPDEVEASAGDLERRELWATGRGTLTVRTRAAGIDAIDQLCLRATPVVLNAEEVGVVYLPLVEDLLDLALASPWSEDKLYLSGLRAILANGRYSSRDARTAWLARAS